jgi:hypothetical protein
MARTKRSHEPRASRPTQPAGYWDSRPLPWQWARQRLVDARNYWIATVSSENRAHTRPVWGVWLDDDRLYFVRVSARTSSRTPN